MLHCAAIFVVPSFNRKLQNALAAAFVGLVQH